MVYRLLSRDELSYHRHGKLWCIREYCVSASGKPLKPYKMGRERGREICLTLDWCHGVVFSAQKKCRTLDLCESGEEVERVAFPAWTCVPTCDLWTVDSALHHVRIARRAGVER